MSDLFFKANRAEGVNVLKVLKIVFIICLVLLIGLLPAVKAYAAGAFTTILVGTLVGTAVGTVLGVAGCTAVVCFLAAMGVSITVSMLYALFDNEDFAASFTQAWENFTLHFTAHVVGDVVMLSGAGFKAFYDMIKTYIVDSFEVSVMPDLNGNYPYLNAVNLDWQPGRNADTINYMNTLNPGTEKWTINGNNNGANLTIDFINSTTNWESNFKLMFNNKLIYFTYQDSHYHIKFKGNERYAWALPYRYACLCQPLVYNNTLYLIDGWTSNTAGDMPMDSSLMFTDIDWNDNSNRAYFTVDDNNAYSSTDLAIQRNRNTVFYVDSESVTHNLGVKLPDGTVINEFTTVGNFLYYILCTECSMIDTATNDVLNSNVGEFSNVVNNYYSEQGDVVYNYYNEIAAADAAGTLATGTDTDVKITSASLSNSVAMTDTIAGSTVITNVESAVETTTGEVISVSPTLTCKNGINLIRASTGAVADKFPFAVVYVLRDSFNVLAAARETPHFTIPLRFNIAQLVSIDESFEVDFSNLNTIAAIARWGELGAVGIALAILTKRMLF